MTPAISTSSRPSVFARTSFWFIAAAVLVLMLVLAGFWISKPARPNIILVTFDTTRADHLGAYGDQQAMTPAFDDLAAKGVLFERAYAPAPLTLVSHATMLTGLYPPEHGLRVNGTGRLAEQIPVLPQALKRHGYSTGAFVASFVLDSKFGLERGFDVYDDDLSGTKSAPHSTDRRRNGDTVVDSALDWLKNQVSRPFFCWVHLYDAHDPYDPRPVLYGDKFTERPYDAGVAFESQQLERVMKFLKDKHLDEQTIVVVAGDHGEGLGEHNETEHSMLVYNTTLHVPFVISGPEKLVQRGHRVAEPVSLVDLTPTLLDLVKAPLPEHVSGRSLSAALQGGEIASRPCYAETEAPFRGNRWCPLHTVISGNWKYILTTRPELYDLATDPGELNNLLQSTPEQVESMKTLLEEMQENFVLASAENLNLSDADLKKLAGLGYLASRHAGDSKRDESEILPDMKDMLPFCDKIAHARELLRQGQFEEAGKLADEIIAATDKLPMAYVVAGDVLRQKGKLDDAEAAYRKVLDPDPNNAIAHAHLAVVFFLRVEFEKAVSEFREAIKLDPEGSQFHVDLAKTLTHLDRNDEAIAEYQEAIRTDPAFVAAHFDLGLMLARSQRPQEAIASFQQAIRYDATFVKAYLNLAHLYLQQGKIPLAEETARHAVEVGPESFEAHMSYGNVLTILKRFKEALIQFQEANKLRPDDPQSRELIQQLSNAGASG